MKRKTEIRSTRSSAIGNIVGGILFIAFGIFASSMLGFNDSMGMDFGGPALNPGLFFMGFGLVGGTVSILYGLFALKRGGIAEHEIITETLPEQETQAEGDPAEQLRKLKALADEGIISESEYAMKKREILNNKW